MVCDGGQKLLSLEKGAVYRLRVIMRGKLDGENGLPLLCHFPNSSSSEGLENSCLL